MSYFIKMWGIHLCGIHFKLALHVLDGPRDGHMGTLYIGHLEVHANYKE
jgi:hypothetical protein